ncbi:MAG: DUF4412 domain-containing protein [Bacteroidetes bacterium]|nr:DUF4412 domain-containing protein [Bacteroidota bacterium]
MRIIISFVLFLFLNTGYAQSQFEGIIQMKMSTLEKPDMGITKLYFSAAGGRLETEMKISPNMKPFKTVRIFKKEGPNLYYILNEGAGTYSITDLSTYKRIEKSEKEVSVKVIGTEKILGYTCTHVLITSASGETEMWTSKEIIDYDSYNALSESDVRTRNASFAKALLAANAEGFPVKTVKKDSKGGVITIELVKAESKTLDKALFEVPTYYTKTETPTTGLEGMMQEIKQMGDQTVKEE